jgi:hypothetical protein
LEKVVLSSERKEVKVSPDVRAKCVGAYTDIYSLVSVEDRRLAAQVTDDRKRALRPESQTDFFEADLEGEYDFFQNDKGEVTSIVYTQIYHKMNGIKK